jgi:hypothetical protein
MSADYDFGDYTGLQLNFVDPIRRRIIPATRVFLGDRLIFESNSLGCKGQELQPGRPIIGVFGDSIVQGSGLESFVEHIRIGPCQPLNGGVEGSLLNNTVDRVLEIQAKAPMTCVLVHSGWHNLVYGEASEAFWTEQLDRIQGPPVIGHFRLVADYHPDVLDAGYEGFLRDDYFSWANMPLTRDSIVDFKAHLDRFNDFIAVYCADRGRVLIDLEPVLAPPALHHVSVNFMDLIHPRAQSYEMIGAAISQQIEAHILPLVRDSGLEAWSPSASTFASAPSEAPPTGVAADIGRNYPLW